MRAPPVLLVLLCMAMTIGQRPLAAVKDTAFLQGSLLDPGEARLDTEEPRSILWNSKQSIDPQRFAFSRDSPGILTVQSDGDYLVAVTMPVISVNTANNRPSQGLEVYINGQPAPGAIGTSGYIRNQPVNDNMHQESSVHVHLLLAGLSSGDEIEVRAFKTAAAAVETAILVASLYAEYIPASRNVFAALSEGPVEGVNLNPNFEEGEEDPALLAWDSVRNDSGFTHSDVSEAIGLAAGTYLLMVNVPMESTVQRASSGLEILLGGSVFPVPGGVARQGYIRNVDGHTLSSVHWAGLIEVDQASDLRLQMFRLAQAGEVRIQAGKRASIHLERLEAQSGIFWGGAVEVDAPDNPQNWNPIDKKALVWEESFLADTANYRVEGSGIRITREGNYLLLYHDSLESSVARANPRITVEINGMELAGARTATHYMRNSNQHNEATASLVFLLEDIAADDVLTVSTRQEAESGEVLIDVDQDYGAFLTLIRKESFDPGSIDLPPRVTSFTGNVHGFTYTIQNHAVTVDEESITTWINGTEVESRVSTSDGVTTVFHPFEDPPDPQSRHETMLVFLDSATERHEVVQSFTINRNFVRLPAEFALTASGTEEEGFIARISQISVIQSDAVHVHGNTIDGAERQLRGEFVSADNTPYLNEAGPTDAGDWQIAPMEVATVLNFEQDAAGAGNFRADNGAPDRPFPGIPGFHNEYDGIAAEFLTYLELRKGFHRLGVNSSDGFELEVRPAWEDVEGVVLGSFDGNRGAADTRFEVHAPQDGLYPFRLLYFEGGGSASLEFFSLDDQDERMLVNDRDHPQALRAFRSAASRPAIVSVMPQGTGLARQIEFVITDGRTALENGSIRMMLDGARIDPEITRIGNTTTVVHRTSDGGYLPEGAHEIELAFREDSDPPVERTYVHSFVIPGGLSPVLEDEPFAYWRLRELQGEEARNEMGSDHTAFYMNSPGLGAPRLVPGAPDSSVFLDASLDHWIWIPNSEEINVRTGNPGWSAKTVEFWFRSRKLPSDASALPEAPFPQRQVLYEQGGVTRGMVVYLSGIESGEEIGQAELWFNALNRGQTVWGGTLPLGEQEISPNSEALAVSTVIAPDTLYHVVGVYDGDTEPDSLEGTVSLYLNGEPIGTVVGANRMYNHTGEVAIGRRNGGIAFHDFLISSGFAPEIFESDEQFRFDGWIDEFALYNHALPPDRIIAHYKAGITEIPLPGGGISISRDDRQGIILTFEGILHSSGNIDGPFVPVDDAVSPLILSPAESARFYLVR